MKNLNLSTTTNVTSSYSGEFALPYVQAAFLAGITLANETISIHSNVKYKEVVKRLVTSGLVSDDACDFTPTGVISLTERILEPKKLMVNFSVCKTDFVSDWQALQMGMSANNENLPVDFKDFLLANVISSVGYSTEFDIWQGVGGAGHFTGFTTMFLTDTGVTHVSGVTITSANVQAQLARVVEAAGALNTYGENQVIYCAKNVIYSYLISLGGFGAAGLGANGYKGEGATNVQSAPMFFGGIELVQANGMKAGEMVCTTKSNLFFGTSLLSDLTEVTLIDKALIDGSKNIDVVLRWTAAVQYAIPEEIVYYHIY